MTNKINVGDVRRLSCIFQDIDSINADPTTVSVKVSNSIVTSTYIFLVDSDVVKDSIGTYHIDVPLTNGGRWRYQWIGVGAVDVVEENYFDVSTLRI